MTKKLTTSQVQSLRAENTDELFNREAVLAAHAATPARVHASSDAHTRCSRLVSDIIKCIEIVGEPIAPNQLVAMLDANKTPRPVNAAGQPLDDKHYQKRLTDKLWSLAGNITEAEAAKGVVKLAGESDAEFKERRTQAINAAKQAAHEKRRIERCGNGMYGPRV